MLALIQSLRKGNLPKRSQELCLGTTTRQTYKKDRQTQKKPVHRAPIKLIKYLRNLVNISKTLAVKNLWELSNLNLTNWMRMGLYYFWFVDFSFPIFDGFDVDGLSDLDFWQGNLGAGVGLRGVRVHFSCHSLNKILQVIRNVYHGLFTISHFGVGRHIC